MINKLCFFLSGADIPKLSLMSFNNVHTRALLCLQVYFTGLLSEHGMAVPFKLAWHDLNVAFCF